MPPHDYPTSFWSYAETRPHLEALKVRLSQAQSVSNGPAPEQEKYQFITSNTQLKPALQTILRSGPARKLKVGVDCETTGLDPLIDRIRLVQIGAPNFPVLLVDLFELENVKLLQQFFERPFLKILHHGIFDWKMLRRAGIIMRPPYFDTELAYQVLHLGLELPSKLADVAREVLKRNLDKRQQHSDWRGPLSLEQLDYGADDVIILHPLEQALRRQLIAQDLMATAQIEFNFMPALATMELNGIRFDQERWHENRKPLVQQLNDLHQQVQQLNPLAQGAQLNLLGGIGGHFNPNSTPQVQQAISALGIKTKSTRGNLLAPFAAKHPFVKALLDLRSLKRTMVAFEKTLPSHIHPSTGRIHAQFFQLGTVSGRIASNHPNVLNIPRIKAGRTCIAAAPGNLIIKADYSQMELRIMAKLSNDPLLVEAYQQGQDIHKLTASLVTGKPLDQITEEERRLAKALNFGLIYMMQAQKLQIQAYAEYGVALSRKDADRFIKAFFDRYIGIVSYHNQTRRLWESGVKEVRTLAGRRRRWSNQPPLTELVNQPVQGLNADITKTALGRLVWAVPEGAVLLLSPYDEIVVECPEAIAQEVAALMQREMIAAAAPLLDPIPVEVEVKIGLTWS